MEVLYFLIPLSFILAIGGLSSFIWAVRNGQFEDLQTPAERILFEDNTREDKH